MRDMASISRLTPQWFSETRLILVCTNIPEQLPRSLMTTPLIEIPGPPADGLSIGLGVAAVVLVAGWVLTRWHRDQMRFTLMRTALERGVTRFPGIPPYWIVSLRQGVTLVALGIGLGVVGAAAWWMVRGVEMPTVEQAMTRGTAQANAEPQRQGPLHERLDGEGPRAEDRDFGPGPGQRPAAPPPPKDRGQGRPQDGPPGREEREGRRGERPNPPPGNPMMERWHRAEAQQTVGMVSAGAGLILLILGIVRIGFAKVEQRYAGESDEAGGVY
jgi:hypothetical protein